MQPKSFSSHLMSLLLLNILLNSSCFGNEKKIIYDVANNSHNSINTSRKDSNKHQTIKLIKTQLQDTIHFNLADFDKINIGKGVSVEIVKSNHFSVEMAGNKISLANLQPFVRNKTLLLKYTGSPEEFEPQYDVTIFIRVPIVSEVNLNGATKSVIKDFADLPSINIQVSGTSVLSIKNCSAKKAWLNISGMSNLYGYDFLIQNADVNISAKSIAEVTINENLSGNVSNEGQLNYKGNAVKTVNISGAGKVVKK